MSDNSSDATRPTETQPAPNISIEHQRDGDGRSPSDTLDRGQDEDRETPGGQSQERVEDRPNVGTTTPDAYPEDQRAGVTP
ncbi:hypothetical protein [Sphingomonas sp. RS2018]